MSDTILDLMTRVSGLDAMKTGMADVANSVTASTQKMSASYSTFAANAMAANEGVKSVISMLPPEFIKFEAGGIAAFEQIKRRVIEATSEVGALRQEILSTNDAAKLQQLNAQLDQARARMTAARTEMRAMRMEMSETREKADLLGESLGVKIPSSLGRLLGQIPFLQKAMNAAFAPIAVLFFADALVKVVEWIEKATESLAGYTEAVKKSIEEAKKANEEQVRHAGSVREANEKVIETNRRLGEVGKQSFADFTESAKKAKEETSTLLDILTIGTVAAYRTIQHATTDAANETALLNDRLREQEKNLMEVGAAEDRATLKSKEQREAAEQIGKSRISQLREEIRALNEKQAPESKIAAEEAGSKKNADAADRLRAIAAVEADFAGKRLELQRHLAEEFANITIAAAKSEVAARQAIEMEFISFYESGLHQMYAAGQITLAEELAGEKVAATQRLAVRLSEIEQKKSLALREQSATGKDATPEVTTLDEERIRAEVQTQEKINELTQRSAQEALRERNEINLATIEGAKRVGDAEINAVEQSARAQLAARRISLEEETTILKAAAAQRIDSDIAVANEQLRQAQEFPERNKKAIITLNADLIALERQKVADLARIDAEYTSKHLEEVRRDMEETLRFVNETSNRELAASKSTDDLRLRSHQVTLSAWGAMERAAVDRWVAEQSAALDAVLAKEKAMYGQDSLEYKKLIDKKNQLDQERVQKLNQIDQQIIAKQEQMFNKITGEFNRSIVSWADGTQTFGASMAQLWKGIADTAIANILKMTEQMIMAEIQHKAIAQTGVLTDAKSAGASAFKWVMADVPFPLNAVLAPAAAAAAFAGVMAFGAFEKGGIVPETAMALVHKNEMVLPAHLSSFVRTAAASVGGADNLQRSMAALHGDYGGGGSIGAAAGGARGTAGFGSSVTNKTINMRPTIIVNNPGQKVSQAEIENAVKRGVRSGALDF